MRIHKFYFIFRYYYCILYVNCTLLPPSCAPVERYKKKKKKNCCTHTSLSSLVVFVVPLDCPQLFIDLVKLSHLTERPLSLLHLSLEHQPPRALWHEQETKEHDQGGYSGQSQHEPVKRYNNYVYIREL